MDDRSGAAQAAAATTAPTPVSTSGSLGGAMSGAPPGGRELSRKKLIVPGLVGLHEDDAQVVLRNTGFAQGLVQLTESYESEGAVVQQDPPKGHLAAAETRVRLFVSRLSVMRFLPSVYQQTDSLGQSELRQVLWIFQTLFESLTRRIQTIHRLFDPRTVDEGFVAWLAGWIGLTLQSGWTVDKKRKVLRRAAKLYGLRGTKEGLAEMIRLMLDLDPAIQENVWPLRGFRIGVSSQVGIDSVVLPYIDLAHTFVVTLPVARKDATESIVARTHEVIQAEKPAHTTYLLQFKAPVAERRGPAYLRIGVSKLGLAETAEVLTPETAQQIDEERAEVEAREAADAAVRRAGPRAAAARGRPGADGKGSVRSQAVAQRGPRRPGGKAGD